MDLACALMVVGLLGAVSIAYGVRARVVGPAREPRVDAEGRSAVVTKGAMEMFYWGVSPIASSCIKLRVSPDAVTYASLAFGAAAGIAFAAGHFGIGALLAALGSSCDALDGVIARRLGIASEAGEVLDAAADRYVDFAWLAGIAFYFRGDATRLVIALLALHGAFMVSYSTAKAEALGIAAPRGSMRRVERAVIIVTAACATPIVAALDGRAADVPLVIATTVIALFANTSAVRRLAVVFAGARAKETNRLASPATGAARVAE